ncbi:MAG TPA: PrgI family protein [Candidatus Dojkabacteria bacterium]|nr:PrgI family protein [Candidatus Dojkabacteria bacterium]HNW23268.1 PrgI family protein [Candidatus Dojkabacteria bacterium]
MRQHPIPQNVLDVEFKLFTKFTLREFAYLALGVGIGGIFLYFTTKDQIPGIIGVPIFVIFSALGAFFALVPINDQPADKFVTNFFNAINKPTQRVWLNTELKNQRAKPVIQTEQKKSKIIGGFDINKIKKQIFKEQPQDDILTPTSNDNSIIINEENISKYQFNIKSVDKLPGNINIWLVRDNNQPIPSINTYLKDSNNKILYANKTDKNGYFISNRVFPDGIYNIEFENLPSKPIPIKIVLTKNMGKLPYKIKI